MVCCVSSSLLSTAVSSAGGVGDTDGDSEGEWSSDGGTFSFFFRSPLAFDSMAGMAGGSSDCTGLTGSDRRLLITCSHGIKVSLLNVNITRVCTLRVREPEAGCVVSYFRREKLVKISNWLKLK